SRILTALIKACPVNPQQRGFIISSGCSKNFKLLQLLIQCAKREHQPLGAIFLDLTKAFDAVSHSHIILALKQKGIDDHFIALIKNLYHNITTQMD
ncbi:POLR protein, partial [Fregetta grallaria]|nr:POLR protein [Fregetta grallaria]